MRSDRSPLPLLRVRMDGTVAGYAVTVIPTRAGAFIGEAAEVAEGVAAAEGVAVVVDLAVRPAKNMKGP
jgi:hypothetical protein